MFFFKQKTAYEMRISDWSSDVCSSDLDMGSFKVRELKTIKKLLVIVSTHGLGDPPPEAEEFHAFLHSSKAPELKHIDYSVLALGDSSYRSEERRVGKECVSTCRYRWSQYH